MFDPRKRKRQRRRRQKIEQKKIQLQFNWFLGFITALLWICLSFVIVYIEPELVKNIPFQGWYGPFFLLVFLTLWASVRLLTGNRKRAALLAAVITFYLILRLNQFGQWYNATLLIALSLVIEYFWISQFKYRWLNKPTRSEDVVKSEHESK